MEIDKQEKKERMTLLALTDTKKKKAKLMRKPEVNTLSRALRGSDRKGFQL